MRHRLALALLPLLASCFAGHTVYRSPGELIAAERGRIRIELHDGRTLVVDGGRIVGDTLHATGVAAAAPVRVPMDSVRRIVRDGQSLHPYVLTGLAFLAGLAGSVLLWGELLLG